MIGKDEEEVDGSEDGIIGYYSKRFWPVTFLWAMLALCVAADQGFVRWRKKKEEGRGR